MRTVSRIAVFVLMATVGCSLLSPESDTRTFKLVTEEERYSISDSIDIALTYTNTSSSPVYLRKCNSEKPIPIVEKRTGVNWKTAYMPACYDPASKPIELKPEETYTTNLVLYPNQAGSVNSYKVTDWTGAFRVRGKAYKTWDGNYPLEDPVEHASNVFHIES